VARNELRRGASGTLPSIGGEGAIRLFCFPYAGSGTSIYRGWGEAIARQIEVWPVPLPGREHRLAEAPIDDLVVLAAVVAEELGPFLDSPFALFGHSMGALLAFEVARHLRREGRENPACLAVSAHRAPHIPKDHDRIYDKPTLEFLEELRRLKGTPAEVLANPELLALMLPTLRADFKAVELYRHIEEPPLECPIVAYGGTRDEEIREEQLVAWRTHTIGEFSHRMFDGDHFYLNTRRDELITQLKCDLERAPVATTFALESESNREP
jgi:medium-chain acyl-[acyl-carrier-protein] hydrolase